MAITACGDSGDNITENNIFCDISYELFEELSDSNEASEFEAISFTENRVTIEASADFCQFIQIGDTTTNTNTTNIDTDIAANATLDGDVN